MSEVKTKTAEEIKAEEEKLAAEAGAKEESKAKGEVEKAKQSVVNVTPEEENTKLLGELEKRGVLKKHGGIYVESKFDPNLLPEVKEVTNKVVDKVKAANEKVSELEASLTETKKKLQSKEDMEAAEKKELTEKLAKLDTDLSIERKKFEQATTQLVKTQTAVKKGLPFNFLDYVKGESAEEIEASVDKVMNDFALQKNKFTEEELKAQVEAAADKARKETAEQLKARGKSTENSGVEPGHIYTKAEIAAMSIAEFKTKRSEILDQQKRGLIK